jgi:hypothetical protein
MTAERYERPWYRHFWVWFLIAPPAATVIFWTVILTTMASPPSLVVDDYGKIGLAYENDRARDTAARDLGVTGRLDVQREGGRVTVALVGLDDPPQRLRVTLAHPTEAARDRTATLERIGGGLYRGELGGAAQGRRYITLLPVDGGWRLAGELSANRTDMSLKPPAPSAAR